VNSNRPVRLRRIRTVHVAEASGRVSVYPEPYLLPVLPKGWAPLGPIEQSALLEACDARPGSCRLRLGSLWNPRSEYRVYCLDDQWAGACAATMFDAEVAGGDGRNTRLLGVGISLDRVLRLALDFVNWDLEADGAAWRLSLVPATQVAGV
jgi:hypothetical protein